MCSFFGVVALHFNMILHFPLEYVSYVNFHVRHTNNVIALWSLQISLCLIFQKSVNHLHLSVTCILVKKITAGSKCLLYHSKQMNTEHSTLNYLSHIRRDYLRELEIIFCRHSISVKTWNFHLYAITKKDDINSLKHIRQGRCLCSF